MMYTIRITIAVLTFLCTASVASSFDECSTAIPLGVDFSGGPFSLSGLGGTDNPTDPIRCSGDAGHNTIWGYLTPTVDGFLNVSGDASISIYSGTCGALTELACTSPTSPDFAFLEGGETYYLVLSAPPDVVTYTTAFCGDGTVLYQECDDGNLVDTDACTNRCRNAYCGDGTLYVGVEECDDGNAANEDACTAACLDNVCGDGFLHTGVEECDDGDLDDGDGCDSDCTVGTICGNGVPEAPNEECDDGNGSNADACLTTCELNVCGDGFTNTGVEECDDGNLIDGDGCDADCRLPWEDDCANAVVLLPSMPNFFNSAGATTDPADPIRTCTSAQGDNNLWATFAVPPDQSGRLLMMTGLSTLTSIYTGSCGALSEVMCQAAAPPPGPFIATTVNGGENLVFELSGPESGFAVVLSICGNGMVEFPLENCDDDNDVDLDGCSNKCRVPACGDGDIQMGEQCDDGNLVNGDGCEDDCFVTSVCGDNVVEGHETCDDGNLMDDDGCDSDCRLPCPDNICKCLGAANQFAVVGGKLNAKSGKFSEGGETEYIPNEIDGSVCGLSGTFGAKSGGETDVGGDLVLTRPDGTAGKFKGYKEDDMFLPGSYVLGDLVTGGGEVKGPLLVDVGGVTDVSGAHPLVPICTQARLDVTTAATTLAALTPNQTIPEIKLDAGEEQTVVVGNGRQVVSIGSIKLKGYTSELDGALLTFQMGPSTDVLIINVASLSLGQGTGIVIEEGGNGAYAVVNLGPEGKATIKKEAFLGAPLIGVKSSISVPDDAFTDAIFTAQGVKLQGATIESSLECEE